MELIPQLMAPKEGLSILSAGRETVVTTPNSLKCLVNQTKLFPWLEAARGQLPKRREERSLKESRG